jgi:hypothetical protein
MEYYYLHRGFWWEFLRGMNVNDDDIRNGPPKIIRIEFGFIPSIVLKNIFV